MDKYNLKKNLLSISFTVILFVQQMVLFNGLQMGLVPQYWIIDLSAYIVCAIILYLLPINLQYLISLLIMFLSSLMCIVNLTLYETVLRIFDWSMLKLLGEAGAVFGMARFPFGDVACIIVLFFSYIALVAIISLIRNRGNYKRFIKQSGRLVFVMVAILIIIVEAILPQKIISCYDEMYFVSDSYEYVTFQSPYISLKKFGMFGYYGESLLRTVFPKLKPQFPIDVLGYKFEDYTSVLTDVVKDGNVIVVLAESFEDYAISKELTPTLYALKNGVNLSGCGVGCFYDVQKTDPNEVQLHRKDYTYQNGEYEKNSLDIFSGLTEEQCGLELMMYKSNEITNVSEAKVLTGSFDSWEFSLPNKLNDNGYITNYIHANNGSFYQRDTYIEQDVGFNNAIFYEDMSEWLDSSGNLDCFARDSDIINYYINNESKFDLTPDEKFLTFFMTITTHGNYIDSDLLKENYKFFDAVNSLGQESSLFNVYNSIENKELKSVVRNYLARALDTEKAVSLLINDLFEEDKLEETLLVFVSDHNAYADNILSFKEMYYKETVGESWYGFPSEYNVPCFFYNPKINKDNISSYNEIRKVEHLSCAYDVVPTILSLVGAEYNKMCYMGTPVVNKSVIDGKCVYNNITYSETNGVFIGEDYTTYDGYEIKAINNLNEEKIADIKFAVNEYRAKKYFVEQILFSNSAAGN